jgi:hypothetical protein
MLPGAEGLINSPAFKNSFGMIMDNEGLRVIDRACDFKVLYSQTEIRGQKSESRGQESGKSDGARSTFRIEFY